MIELKKDGNIYVVTMNNGQNMICPDWQNRMLEILDIMESEQGAGTAMVIIGEEKFFSNGLNLEVLKKLDKQGWAVFGKKMNEIHRRMLILPFPTVAAVNGHAFAGGAFVAMSCDYRIMREDRGWICISEVDAGVPLPDPMMDILRGKVPPPTARDAILTGKRYAADEAIAAGFADGKAPLENLLGTAKDLAANLATKEPGIFATIKQTYFGPMANGLL
ncbi:MAG: enoyl-CoA hydratase/isomerase family protein [Porticoccaceae bacterium]|jgi:enoyl-CoA hydratase/carnithine racemase|nr:enoyl-CoA hydratase/isomerase family protein [Porticoccaceae bacterium]